MERHHPSSFLMVLHVSLCLFFCFFAAEGEVKSLSVDFTHDLSPVNFWEEIFGFLKKKEDSLSKTLFFLAKMSMFLQWESFSMTALKSTMFPTGVTGGGVGVEGGLSLL